MGIDRLQGQIDAKVKERLEEVLRPRFRRANDRIVREVIKDLGLTGILPDVSRLTAEEYEILLDRHFDVASKFFSGSIRGKLSPQAESTEIEDAEIFAALLLLKRTLPVEQTAIMSYTNQRDAERAVTAARQQTGDTGFPLSQQEVAATAGAQLNRRLRGREKIRAMTATQKFSESSKQVEFSVLAGATAAVKQWVTVGDDHVRSHHAVADGQTVLAQEPFTVNGEQLRFPGDSWLGASANNTVNCRCSSVPDVDSLAAARQQ